MKEQLVGREHERRILQRLYDSSSPEFLALYGRRRVGKTFLIRETCENSEIRDNLGLLFELTGQKDGSRKEQLGNFADVFGRHFLSGHRSAPPDSWRDALAMLAGEIDRRKPRGKVVFFFDELPWLAARRSGFLQALDYFWNHWASRRANVLLIVCGSAASWMIDKILNAKGGLHNRVTERIRLLPFSLGETERYLQSRRIHLERKQIMELYMAVGGIPHYLRQVRRGQSAAQNIDRICFSKDGFLVDEFGRLFASLFEFEKNYIRVIEALARKRGGLARNELLASSRLRSGGRATQTLKALEESGFIAGDVPFGKKSNEPLYRLADEYSLFYLTWINAAPGSVIRSAPGGYWLQQRNGRKWSAWSGYAFERLCQKHVGQLLRGLGIHGISTIVSGWYHRPREDGDRGAQIDLLIDRSDQCINLCEMKFSDAQFVIGKAYADELRAKREVFKNKTRTRKTLFITMVTPHGVKDNAYRQALVDQQLTMDILFGGPG